MALTTTLTTIELEARDTTIHPLTFNLPKAVDYYEVGDSVIVNAADGGVFIGHVEDIEEERLRFYVELD